MGLFQKIFNRFFKQFVNMWGREPQTPAEWMRIQDEAVRHLNKTKGAPPIKKEPTLQDVLEGKKIEDAQGRTLDFGKFKWRPEDAPLRGGKPELVKEKTTIDEVLKEPVRSKGPKGPRNWDFSQKKGKVLPFPDKGIRSLIKKGDVQVGKAPKTTKETLDKKKDRGILLRDADEAIADIKRKNKQAVEDFKRKFLNNEPKTVEDLRDKGDWDPYGMAEGGIAPLVGEPTYAADFYDDRTPMAGGLMVKGGKWMIKSLLDTRQKIKTMTLAPHQMKMALDQIDNHIRNIKAGGPIPEEAIQTIRKDPKFRSVHQTRSTDPDMFEMEQVVLDYGKKHAGGGRIGLFGGGAANWFIKNFKSLIDEAANPGPWSRFSKMGAKDKQAAVADAKEMIKNLEAGDSVPEYLLEDIVANPKFTLKRSKATDPDLVEVENLVEGYNRLKLAREKKFRGEIKLSPNDPSGAYSRNASSALDDYNLFTPTTTDMYGKTWKRKKDWIKEERAKIKKTQKEIGSAPSSRHSEYRSMVQIRKGLEDRLTALDITEELGGNIKMFDKLRMHNYPTYKNTLDKRDWLMPPGGLKRREAFVIDLGHHTLPPKKAEGGRIGFNPGGPVDQEALIQMYLAEGLSYEEAVAAAQATSGLDMDISKKAEGGRAEFIFGGSAGLRALLKRLKGKNKRVFPPPPQGIGKFMGKGDTDYIDNLKLQQLETILRAAKIDKETLAHQAMVKKMNDPGLNFLMGKLDEAGLKAQNLDKYTDIDKDIMDIEMMIKNYTQKKLKRKLNAEGGIIRAGYFFGGKALKAIRDAWRANKTWGVGGPPYNVDATSFDIKKMTKKHLGQEFSLKELKELSDSPLGEFASRGTGRAPPKFEDFNKEFKNIKAQILKEKMRESKIQAEAMIKSADVIPVDNPTAKKVQAQFTREGKKQLEEANEGLKAIDIYMGMLQKTGRKLHAEGGRIGYSGGGKAGLPAVTMGTPQMNIQQPQMPAGPQPAGIPGGTIVAQNQMQQSPWMGSQMQQGIGGMPQRGQPIPGGMPQRGQPIPGGMPQRGQPIPGGMPRPMANAGGRIGFGLGGINKARRAFLKKLAGLTGVGVAAGTGLLKFGKAAKVVPKVTETAEVITRGADGMPTYITDLIEVVKAKGVKKIMDSNINKYPDTVHSYKGVDVTEDAAGNIKIKSDRGGVATDPYTGKTHEGIAQEHHMQIERGQMGVKDEGLETQKTFQEPDEYIEGTVRPDHDGKMKDFEEGLDEDIHEFFKEIADEIDTLVIKKASGGLAYALGE